MRTQRAQKVGRFSIDFEVANNDDLAAVRRGDLDPAQVRRQLVSGVVDSGATRLVLPQSVAKQLGLLPTGKIQVRYADRRKGAVDKVEGVYVEIQGRHGVFTAAVEPRRRNALIGAFVLEELDFLIDCTKQRLVPRNPRYITGQMEIQGE